MNNNLFAGIFTALITPFKNGEVDMSSLKRLVSWQLEQGVDGFVINGTTAESPTLLEEEVEAIWVEVKKWVPENFPLLLGTGSNSTMETCTRTRRAFELGASGALVVVPYYNKPTQRGMYEHFKKVADVESTFPIILYNVPGRTVVSMDADTAADLSKIENIVGIKEASGDMELAQKLLDKVDSDFIVTSGDDSTCMNLMSLGGKGVISVISHIIPKELKTLSLRAREGDKEALVEYQKFTELNKLLGCEPNPTPVKKALQQMGIISSAELRLPLVELSQSNSEKMSVCLKSLGVVS